MADKPISALIATFNEVDDASKWLKHAHTEHFAISEGIVLQRDADGKIHEHLANLPGVGAAAGVGVVIGAIVGAIFPPALLGSALAGAIGMGVGGAALGAAGVAIKDEIVDRNAFREVAEALAPGQSALVVVMASDAAGRFSDEITDFDKKWIEEIAAA
jgi:uncharacterized membrane protein